MERSPRNKKYEKEEMARMDRMAARRDADALGRAMGSQRMEADEERMMRRRRRKPAAKMAYGGKVKKMAKGGSVSKRADGCCMKGKTRGKMC